MNWIEAILFFVFFGAFGVFLEILFTSLENLKKKKDKCLKGTSSLWMFFVYGSVYFIVLFVTTYFSDYNILLRGLIYMILFYLLEFTSGFILKKFHAIPWDYSRETKFHFKGIIRLEFAPIWFLGGLFAEAVYYYVAQHLIF
jgi:uncharacterized membrane protein